MKLYALIALALGSMTTLPTSLSNLSEFLQLGISVRQAPSEYELKASLLFKFIPFIEWPEIASKNSTLNIGVVGKNPFGRTLDSLDGYKLGTYTIRIEYFNTSAHTDQFKKCQILYLATFESAENRILEVIAGQPILSIADSEGFAERGGVIEFVKKRSRITFEINHASATKAGLNLCSQLLRLAEIVYGDDNSKMRRNPNG